MKLRPRPPAGLKAFGAARRFWVRAFSHFVESDEVKERIKTSSLEALAQVTTELAEDEASGHTA